MDRTPAPAWSPYGNGIAPQSAMGVVLSEVMANYCLEQWGMRPDEVLAALRDPESQDEDHSIASTVSFLSGLMLSGELPTFVRPFGGGDPRPFAPACWEIDDPRARFITSAVDPDRWAEEPAAPSHWIFVDGAAFDRFIEEWCQPGEQIAAEPNGTEPKMPGALDRPTDDTSDDANAAMRPLRASPPPPVQSASSDTPPETAARSPTAAVARPASARPRVMLRLDEVKARTGVSRSQIYKRMDLGTFPASVQLGARMVGWFEDEVDAWIAALPR